MTERPTHERSMTVRELRGLLAELPDALPVNASYDFGCAEGSVTQIVEEEDEIVLVVD